MDSSEVTMTMGELRGVVTGAAVLVAATSVALSVARMMFSSASSAGGGF